MFIKLIILSCVFLAIAGIGLGISMLMKPQGRFPDTHVGSNPEMRKRGITCAQNTDVGCNPTKGFPGCAACNIKL